MVRRWIDCAMVLMRWGCKVIRVLELVLVALKRLLVFGAICCCLFLIFLGRGRGMNVVFDGYRRASERASKQAYMGRPFFWNFLGQERGAVKLSYRELFVFFWFCFGGLRNTLQVMMM